MEVAIDNAPNVPEDHIISVRFGGIRRQATLGKLRGNLLKFPCKLEACTEPMKIEVMGVVATALVVLQPGEANYEVMLNREGGDGGKIGIAEESATPVLNMRVQSSEGAATSATTRPPSSIAAMAQLASSSSSSTKCPEAAAAAQEYLECHGLLRYIQALLHAIIQAKPDDPYKFITKQLEITRSETSINGGAHKTENLSMPTRSSDILKDTSSKIAMPRDVEVPHGGIRDVKNARRTSGKASMERNQSTHEASTGRAQMSMPVGVSSPTDPGVQKLDMVHDVKDQQNGAVSVAGQRQPETSNSAGAPPAELHMRRTISDEDDDMKLRLKLRDQLFGACESGALGGIVAETLRRRQALHPQSLVGANEPSQDILQRPLLLPMERKGNHSNLNVTDTGGNKADIVGLKTQAWASIEQACKSGNLDKVMVAFRHNNSDQLDQAYSGKTTQVTSIYHDTTGEARLQNTKSVTVGPSRHVHTSDAELPVEKLMPMPAQEYDHNVLDIIGIRAQMRALLVNACKSDALEAAMRRVRPLSREPPDGWHLKNAIEAVGSNGCDDHVGAVVGAKLQQTQVVLKESLERALKSGALIHALESACSPRQVRDRNPGQSCLQALGHGSNDRTLYSSGFLCTQSRQL